MTEQRLHRVFRHLLATESIGMGDLVFLVVVMTDNFRVHITRYGNQQHLIIIRSYHCIDHRIGTSRLVLALVGTEQHHGEWIALIDNRLRLNRFVLVQRLIRFLLKRGFHFIRQEQIEGQNRQRLAEQKCTRGQNQNN
ncbi:hypothetical protein D3C73_1400950 [compost metagenome]